MRRVQVAGNPPAGRPEAVACRARIISAPPHYLDSDCTVDPQTDLCTVCGAGHCGPPCDHCGGVAFHTPACPTILGPWRATTRAHRAVPGPPIGNRTTLPARKATY